LEASRERGDDHLDVGCALAESHTGLLSCKLLESRETLSFEFASDDRITMALNGLSFSFLDGEDTSPSTRTQADTLLATASAAFVEALHQLTVVGSKYMTDFGPTAYSFCRLLFHDETFDTTMAVVRVSRDHVYSFEPRTTQPSEFEAQFGADYRQ
jgi:hypothetical protein